MSLVFETSIEADRAWLAEMRQVNMSIFAATPDEEDDEEDERPPTEGMSEAEKVVSTAQVCAYALNDDDLWTELAGGEWMMLYLVEQKLTKTTLRVTAVDANGDLALASAVGADAELAFANAEGELTEEATSFGELCCGHGTDGSELPYYGVRFSAVEEAMDFAAALRGAAKAMASTLMTEAAIAASVVDTAPEVDATLRTMGFDDASIAAARGRLGSKASAADMANFIIESADLDDEALKRKAAHLEDDDDDDDEDPSPKTMVVVMDDDDDDDDDAEGKREETPMHRLTSSRPSWSLPVDAGDVKEEKDPFPSVAAGVEFSKDQVELTAFDLVEEAAKAALAKNDDSKAADAATRCARQLLFDSDPTKDAFWALVATRAGAHTTARAIRESIEADVQANVVVSTDPSYKSRAAGSREAPPPAPDDEEGSRHLPPSPTKDAGVRFRSLAGVVGKVKRAAAKHSPLKRFGTRKKSSPRPAAAASTSSEPPQDIEFSNAAAAVAAGQRAPNPPRRRTDGGVTMPTTTPTPTTQPSGNNQREAAQRRRTEPTTPTTTTTAEELETTTTRRRTAQQQEDEEDTVTISRDPTAAASQRPAQESLSSQPFQPMDFEAMKVLGRGSFGVVALTKRKSDGKIFAIKVLEKRRLMGQRAESTARLERDVLDQLSKARSMPFVARMRFAFHSLSKLYIAMDFFPNGSLHAVLSKDTTSHRYGRKAARFVAAELACALEHVHRACVIHRDLKPSNVLVDARGHVALSDFGLATRTTARGADLRKRSFVGTVDYASPELLLKSSTRYGTGVDAWALGCLIFEMCTGLPPFHAETTRETFAKIVRAEPKWKTITNLDPDAKTAMVKLLAKNPADRLGSGGTGFRHGVPWFATLPDWGERLLMTEAPLDAFLREKIHKNGTLWSAANAKKDPAQARRETLEAKALFEDNLAPDSPAARALRAKDHAFHGFSRPPSVASRLGSSEVSSSSSLRLDETSSRGGGGTVFV